jgi:ABC-2 type transport system ATP-binding protein
MIEMKNISKRYGELIIYKDMNISFEAGKITHIKGRNGTGKSVLLKLILGYAKADEGTICADGIMIGRDTDFLPDAGAIINTPEFIKNLTGRENLQELAKIRKRTDESYVTYLSELMGMKEALNKKYGTYSVGMRQKLRLIQALMEKHRYLLLDEPFDGLDAESERNVTKLLDEYIHSDQSRYLIYTNHNPEEKRLSDIIYTLNEEKHVLEKEKSLFPK